MKIKLITANGNEFLSGEIALEEGGTVAEFVANLNSRLETVSSFTMQLDNGNYVILGIETIKHATLVVGE